MILGVLVLGFILRVLNLNQSLWLDEGTQAVLSSKSLYSIFFERAADFHPPLSYILLHFWMMLGTSEVWLRLLSVIFGMATIYIVYLLTKDLFNKKIAILAALLLSIAPYHVYYSQEIRMYSEATFFAVLSMYFFIKNLKSFDSRNLKFVLGFIFSTSLLIYTFYLGFFLVASQLLFILLRKKEQLFNFLKNIFIVIVLWIPWIPQFVEQFKGGISAEEYLPGWGNLLSMATLKALPLTFLKFSIGRIDFDNMIVYMIVAVIVFSLFGYLIFRGIRKIQDSQWVIIFWLVVPLFLSLIISLQVPLNQPFRLIFILPAFYILLAVGVDSLAKLKNLMVIFVIAISLISILILNSNPKFLREDWRGATRFINENCQKCVAIFVWPEPFAPYQWYKGVNGIGIIKTFPASKNVVSESLMSVSKDEIYLFEYLQDLSDPEKVTKKWLNENGYQEIDTFDFNGLGFIRKYVKS